MMSVASFAKLHNLNATQRKDCILINEVKRYTFLYDKNEMNHKRSRYRQAAWEEIGRKLGMDGIDCMNRWKVIRDRYRKEKKERLQGSSSKPSRSKRWMYYDLCTFLDPFLEDVKPFKQELEEIMNADIAEDSSQDGEEQMETRSDEKDSAADETSTSLQDSSSSPPASTATISVAPLHGSTPTALMPPNTFIRIVMPSDIPQETTGKTPKARRGRGKAAPSSGSPRKFVKILPKTPSQGTSRNGGLDDDIDLSMYRDKDQMDTVDHLMSFMGNTLKQLSFKKQVKVCQELTAVFFNIISSEEQDDSS